MQLARLSLRLRVFLFFVLLAAGGLLITAGGLTLGWSRSGPAIPATPFVTAFMVFAFFNTALLLAVWLLFDENVAKPINRLSADLRMRAHSDVTGQLDTNPAQYLGDLAPAAAALSARVETDVAGMAASVARETERLAAEHQRLSTLLSESPVATILVNPQGEIVLYDAQAASLLGQFGTPLLKAPLTEYFTADSVRAAFSTAKYGLAELQPRGARQSLTFRIKALNGNGHMLFFEPPHSVEQAVCARPLVFDFDLVDQSPGGAIEEQPLSELSCVVFDLETTGLSIEQDKVVQIGAVRVLKGALVPGEIFSCYVNPECPIPASSTRIHGISDADVSGAPLITEACRWLNDFSRGSVLVAHNAPFDLGFLKRHAAESDLSWDHPVLDTVLLSALAFGITEAHSLDALCARFGIQIAPEERHTALGDARATAEALVHLLRMLEGRGFTTLAKIQAALQEQAQRLYAQV